MEPAVATKLKGVVMTSSPGPIPAAMRARMRASVPEAHPMAYLAPSFVAISSSNCCTSGPRMNCRDSKTRETASITSSLMEANCAFKSRNGNAGFTASGELAELFVSIELCVMYFPVFEGGKDLVLPQEDSVSPIPVPARWITSGFAPEISLHGVCPKILFEPRLDFLNTALYVPVHGGNKSRHALLRSRFIVTVGMFPDRGSGLAVAQTNFVAEAGYYRSCIHFLEVV